MQFKLSTSLLLSLIPTILALPEQSGKKVAPISGRDEAPGSPMARACTYGDCVSQKGASAGKYCGFCIQVQPAPGQTIYVTDIFQVNGGTGTSSCCDYGPATSCADHWPSVNGNQNVHCANTNNGY